MEERCKRQPPWLSAFWVLLPLLLGGLLSLLLRSSFSLYPQLTLPPLAPPPWLFPLAWCLLYLLMGYGSWQVLSADAPKGSKTLALLLYGAQLLLNLLWPLLFFRLRQWFGALLLLLALLACVLVMVAAWAGIRRQAALLQLPYLLWLCVALYLNGSIWLYN